MTPSRRRVALALALLALPARAVDHDDDAPTTSLPLDRPARPFLLVDAERRFVPGAPASIRVQARGGAPLRVALYRLDDPAAWARRPLAPDGLAVAGDPVGAACERLLRAAAPSPGATAT